MVPQKRRKFSPEYRDEAVRMVVEGSRPVARVARDLGINEGTLGNWVARYRKAHPDEEKPLAVSERVRLEEQDREIRELRMQVEFLKKATAFFASQHQ